MPDTGTLIPDILPTGVHARVLRRTTRHTGGPVTVAVVWADRTSDTCPVCGDPVPQQVDCPVALSHTGETESVSQQHGCGDWLPVIERTVAEPDRAEVRQAVAAVLNERDKP